MNRVVSTKIWDDDFRKLRKKAEENDVTVSELLRMIIYDFLNRRTELEDELREIKTKAERKCDELKKVRGLLGRLSNYTNQITKSLNKIAKQGTLTEEEMKKIMQLTGEVLATCLLVENSINERD